MKIDDVVSLLANRINQAHYMKHWLAVVFAKGIQTGEPKWISVDDRLPETSGQVLGIMKDTLDQYICFFKLSRKLFLVYGAGIDPISDMKVTHWMELPKPPPVNKEKDFLKKVAFYKANSDKSMVSSYEEKKPHILACKVCGDYFGMTIDHKCFKCLNPLFE